MTSFTTHHVTKPGDVPGFGRWLETRVRTGELLGTAVRERSQKLALSGLDDCYVVDLKACPIALGVVRAQMIDNPGPGFGLLMRNTAIDLPEMSKMLGRAFDMPAMDICRRLSPNIRGDMTAAAHVINQTVTRAGKFRQLEHNAYEIALILPQYEMGIAPYYRRVGLPLALLTAEQALAGRVDAEWWVTYNWLWLRVLAAFSGDPTLVFIFHDERDPLEVLSKLLNKSEREAELMMLWQACGRDMFVVEKRFPSLLREMADGPQEWGGILDMSMPSLSAACAAMAKTYGQPWNSPLGFGGSAATTTLFKRHLRPGQPMGEGVAFRVFGTVEEIVSVAAVTFWQNRATLDVLIRKVEGGPAEETIRVIGSGPAEGKHQWLNELKDLAPLAAPLGPELDLRPIVTQAP